MAIAVRSLTKTYKTPSRRPGLRGAVEGLLRPEHRYTHAVKEISFAIAPGEFIGFVGPNGAGKTTTLKMLSGVLYPSAGEARVLGFEPFRRQRDFLKQISIVMGQKNQLTWELPALEYFRLIIIWTIFSSFVTGS